MPAFLDRKQNVCHPDDNLHKCLQCTYIYEQVDCYFLLTMHDTQLL